MGVSVLEPGCSAAAFGVEAKRAALVLGGTKLLSLPDGVG